MSTCLRTASACASAHRPVPSTPPRPATAAATTTTAWWRGSHETSRMRLHLTPRHHHHHLLTAPPAAPTSRRTGAIVRPPPLCITASSPPWAAYTPPLAARGFSVTSATRLLHPLSPSLASHSPSPTQAQARPLPASPSSISTSTADARPSPPHPSPSAASSAPLPKAAPPATTAADIARFHTLPSISFSIIAHVDHGKSTLADRLLEMTGTIPSSGAEGQPNRQVLDKLKVERERGITVKSQAVSMLYRVPQRGRVDAAQSSDRGEQPHTTTTTTDAKRPTEYLLNLIDTPGHVDFAFEVGRSLSACQTALLVVDATQGVQSQTLSVLRVARSRGLGVIPVLNKIDLPASDVEGCLEQMERELGLEVRVGGREEALAISAKTGEGVERVLEELVRRAAPSHHAVGGSGAPRGGNVPAPTSAERQDVARRGDDEVLRALVFDSWYDSYKGVIALISVREGVIRKGDRIGSCQTSKRYEVLDVGVNSPSAVSTGILRKGQVGWMVCNMKDMSEASIGDTIHHLNPSGRVEPLESFQPTVPMVYAAAYPLDTTDFTKLEEAIRRLALNDRSVTVQRESSAALGQGCRLGFLGTLHLDVFRQRLEDEYGQRILVTAPTVPYRIVYRGSAPDEAGEVRICSNPVEWPSEHDLRTRVAALEEPVVRASLVCPEEYVGAMMELCAEHRGEELEFVFEEEERELRKREAAQRGGKDELSPSSPPSSPPPPPTTTTSEVDVAEGGPSMVRMVYRLPLAEIVTDFFSKLKSRSSGFASLEYVEDGYVRSDLVKLSFLIAGAPVDALSMILHRSSAVSAGRAYVRKLKEVIPRQQFEVAIQACVGGGVRGGGGGGGGGGDDVAAAHHSGSSGGGVGGGGAKVVARETLSAYRKDVTAGLYGGHYDRKLKHLNKQKAGKKRLRQMGVGRVQVPQEAFLRLLDARPSSRGGGDKG